MKLCTNCNKEPCLAYGDNFCTKCGNELTEIKEDQYRCVNSDCRMCINEREFREHQKYCGECGSKIVLIKEV